MFGRSKISGKTCYYILVLFFGGLALLYAPCLLKAVTGHPCPACGTRRAIQAALEGNFIDSLLINPYGIFFLLLGTIFLIGFTYDMLSHTKRFYSFYKRTEPFLLNKYILFLIIVAMLSNWIWNFHKFSV